LRLAELLAGLLAQHGDLDKLRTRADADDRDGGTEPAGLLEERVDPDGALQSCGPGPTSATGTPPGPGMARRT
jgi:hypothetical protein